MHTVLAILRRAFPILSAAFLVATACRQSPPIRARIEERLPTIPEGGRPDLSRDEVQQALARQMRTVPLPEEGRPVPPNPVFPTRETLRTFYAGNGDRLAWSLESGLSLPSTGILLDALARASEHGLDPEDYALSRLELLAPQIGKAPLDDSAVARLADFDLLMTAAFFRYASDLSTGRVHPDEIRDDWHVDLPLLEPLTKLDRALNADRLSDLLRDLPPPHAGYVRLRQALVELRESTAEWGTIPDGSVLETGSRGPRVAMLQQRLSQPTVMPPDSTGAMTEAGPLFDDALAELVRRFQKRHGIAVDGKVGPVTLAALNVPLEQRIRQVELNLERWRWVPRQLGDPCIFVNIPRFDLEFIRDGLPAWHSRIVVGRSFTPTPVFSDQVIAVVVNPPWNVPRSIAVKEVLPELRRNPGALKRRGLRLLEGWGRAEREVDPDTVAWHAVDGHSFPFRMRQDPGPNNALGRLKFQLTNQRSIALHDTPARGLFSRPGRNLSHGCIRVERPLELAALLLDESSRHTLHETLDTSEERHLSVQPMVPVHILYLTAWVDEAGVLRFAPDVYGFDEPQRAALDRVAARMVGGPASGAKVATRPIDP